VGWIFIGIVCVFSAAAELLERNGKVSGTTLKVAGLVIGIAYWCVVSVLPR
jgi:hypothetical protein